MVKLTFEEIVNNYNLLLKESQKYNFLVRASELQSAQCEKLEEFKSLIKSFKNQAIKNKNEEYANHFFHFQCVLNACICSLKMWMALKENEFKKSWSLLIDTQDYLSVALKCSNKGYGVEEFIDYTHKVEEIIFPGWPYYNSIGLVEDVGLCSICKQRFDNCEHLEGLVYMGQLCERIDCKPVRLDHLSLVENPKDKRCIITWIATEDGRKRDYITWRIIDDSEIVEERTMGSIAMSFNELDFY